MDSIKDSPKLDRPPTYSTLDPFSVAPPAPQAKRMKDNQHHTWEVHRPRDQSTTGLHIKSNDRTLYYAGHYTSADHPDIILFGGYDSSGPHLAQTSFTPHDKNFQIYIGDRKSPPKDDWDTVRHSDEAKFFLSDPQYRFETRYPSADEDRRTIKRKFHCQKTSDSKLGASRLSPRDFKIVDDGEDDERVVAVYVEHHMGSGEHRGTLRFLQSMPEQGEIACLMVVLSLLEKSRRYMRSVAKAFPSTNGW